MGFNKYSVILMGGVFVLFTGANAQQATPSPSAEAEMSCFSASDTCAKPIEIVSTEDECHCYRCGVGTAQETNYCTSDPARQLELDFDARPTTSSTNSN